MSEGVVEVPLPLSVERLIEEIRVQLLLPMPDVAARKALSKIGEEAAIDVLRRISTSKRIQNFSGFIMYMVNKYASLPWGEAESIRLSTPPSSICSSPPNAGSGFYDSPTSKQVLESPCSCKVSSPVIDECHAPMNSSPQIRVQQQNSAFSCSSLKDAIPASTIQKPSASHCSSPVEEKLFAPFSPQRPMNSSHGISVQLQTSALSCTSLKDALPTTNIRNVSYGSSASHHGSPVKKKLFAPTSPPTPNYKISQQSLLLSELEFRKLFMVLSYIGSNKLEDAISVEDAINIKSMKTIPMLDFEDWMWSKFGCRYCQPCDRAMYLDWDSGKTHLYSCYVSSDGGYQFKGPYLDAKKTHLQRAIGDENVLIVKFAKATDMGNMMTNASTNYEKIAETGILVGLRRYRFFVFKDGGKERQKKGKEDKRQRSSGAVKCYFVPRESIAPWDDRDTFLTNYKTTHDVRCLFMHVHTVSSIAKYMARFSLILSTTIKLQVDLASVLVEEIKDIPCIDERGCIVYDEDGEEQIHTDGTGFISENLAVLVPDNFSNAMYMDANDNEKLGLVQAEIGSAGLRGKEASYKEPPLLIQCRLYKEGYAVKGTLLVNKKLKPSTIQVRQSMIKVDKDPRLADRKSFNSLEVVAVSHKPKAAKLSKPLIALLSIGGVPDAYFLGLLESTLKDARRVCSDPRTAFRVANTYQHIDDSGLCIDMFGARIPLNEPYFQYRLSKLAKEERKGLGDGKIPISESFYLIGTTDPTGTLKGDQVCVILENGQISGKVLVYRNPGLHFGDIHVLNARYVAELEDYIGNAKYAIFFSTKGRRSVANEIANGDFDGDLYWVSRNPQLLENFKASDPWKRSNSTPSASNKKPSDYLTEELEHELFKLLFSAKEHGWAAGIAADSWMAFMDRYLTLQDDDDEKHLIKNKMLQLIDLYYDALDAAKSGKKVVIPHGLRATRFPHHMGQSPEYHSTSVLGLIYDGFQSCKNEKLAVQEIWKLPYFNTSIPPWCLELWKERYDGYRREMSNALTYNDESKNHAANSVIMKYKQMLYGGRNMEDVYDEALAIYHVSYDYAKSKKDVVKCGFAWKVAGSALCAYHRKIHCLKTGEREITFVSSSFDGVF